MNPDHLFNVAAEFAQATDNAERFHARAASATGADRAALSKKAWEWEAIAVLRRKHLRASLREELRGLIVAEPDTELPAALWRRRHVEVRACTGDGSRIRVRCTPTQAVALGTALIGLAALTDQLGGGVLGETLATFPPNSHSTAEPNSHSTAEPETNDENGAASMTTSIDPSENTDGIGDGQRVLDGKQLAGVLALLGTADPVCVKVLTQLNLRVYPGEPGDRTAYVVLDVHGVSIGVKRRADDLYLHADTTETGDQLIAFEINGYGETDHPTNPSHPSL